MPTSFFAWLALNTVIATTVVPVQTAQANQRQDEFARMRHDNAEWAREVRREEHARERREWHEWRYYDARCRCWIWR